MLASLAGSRELDGKIEDRAGVDAAPTGRTLRREPASRRGRAGTLTVASTALGGDWQAAFAVLPEDRQGGPARRAGQVRAVVRGHAEGGYNSAQAASEAHRMGVTQVWILT